MIVLFRRGTTTKIKKYCLSILLILSLFTWREAIFNVSTYWKQTVFNASCACSRFLSTSTNIALFFEAWIYFYAVNKRWAQETIGWWVWTRLSILNLSNFEITLWSVSEGSNHLRRHKVWRALDDNHDDITWHVI